MLESKQVNELLSKALSELKEADRKTILEYLGDSAIGEAKSATVRKRFERAIRRLIVWSETYG